MYCTRLAENKGCKKSQKILHLGTIAQLCRAESLQLRHVSTMGKKLVKQQYLLHMSSKYGELWPTNGWDRYESLWHPSIFQWVSHLGFITAATSLTGGQPNFAQCLAVSWAGTLCIHIRGCCPLAEFCPVQNSLYVEVLCSHILAALLHGTAAASVSRTLRHGTRNGITELSQRAPPRFSWAAITLDIGSHSTYYCYLILFQTHKHKPQVVNFFKCWNGTYSGWFSFSKPLCSKTALNHCTTTEIIWNREETYFDYSLYFFFINVSQIKPEKDLKWFVCMSDTNMSCCLLCVVNRWTSLMWIIHWLSRMSRRWISLCLGFRGNSAWNCWELTSSLRMELDAMELLILMHSQVQ